MSSAGKFMRILNVAEKNDAAKAIASFLSNGHAIKKDGRSKYNKIFEFDYNLNGSQNQMTMTSVSGHLMNYEFPINCKNWNTINPVELFDQPIYKKCTENCSNIKRSLEELIRRSDLLIIWTDCDREGENIGMEIVDVCKAVKSNLQVKRAKFSQISKTSVTHAINNLVEIDIRASDAVDVRQQLDLRIGASFTRFQTLHLRRIFPDVLIDNLISYGSCQFPTLGFVVNRSKEIEDFIIEPFWKIVVKHKKNNESTDFNWDKTRLFDEDSVLSLLENITEGGSLACVFDISTKPKSKWRPTAMDTIELEKLSSRKLGINAKTTMQIAEKLYSQGYISYPRTETNIFPKDIDLRPLVEIQCNDDRWTDFAITLLNHGLDPRNGKKSDQAHPPIHPLKLGKELQNDEGRIYELVVRHFLACLSQDATGSETKVSIECVSKVEGGNVWPTLNGKIHRSRLGEVFHITGLVILQRNYLDVYPYDKWTDKELPLYVEGEIFEPDTVRIERGETSPPQLLTEADLISLMDKHGIGTDATHAEHIFKVKERNYITTTGPGKKYLIPEKLGRGLVEGYDLMGFYLAKPNLRARFEADLEEICRGTKQPSEVLREHVQEYKNIFKEAVIHANKLVEGVGKFLDSTHSSVDSGFQSSASYSLFESPLSVRACPLCSGSIVLKQPPGKSWLLGCSNYPACSYTLWLPITVEQAAIALDPESGSPIVCTNAHDNSKNCPVHKISLKFSCRMSLVADIAPDEERRYIFCVYCNVDACDFLNINLPKERSQSLSVNSVSQLPYRSETVTRPQFPSRSETVTRPQFPSRSETVTRPQVPISSTSSASLYRKPISSLPGPDDIENVPLCYCGTPTVKRKVIKEGPNKGRFFYCCADKKCNSFYWSEDVVSSAPSTSGHTSVRGPPPSVPANNDSVTCACSEPATMFTVHKEGPNKGRQFFSCQSRKCGFFQWADESPQTSKPKFPKRKTTSETSAASAAKKTFTSTENMWPPMAKDFKVGAAKPKAPRRCTRCKTAGHTAKTCSNT